MTSISNARLPRIGRFHRGPSPERGFFLVIGVFLISLVAFAFLALLGMGLATANKIKLQNVANLAALAAVNGYSSGDPLDSYATKVAAAEASVSNMLDDIDGPVFEGSAESLSLSADETPNGKLAFVNYVSSYRSNLPAWITHPSMCGDAATASTHYPCLIRSAGITGVPTDVNGVEVTLRNAEAWQTPFSKFLDGSGIKSQVGALAVNLPRCFMVALDTSLSIVGENFSAKLQYEPASLINAQSCALLPPPDRDSCLSTKPVRFTDRSHLFVYRAGEVETADGDPPTFDECRNMKWFPFPSLDKLVWCSMISAGAGTAAEDSREIRSSDLDVMDASGKPKFFGDDYEKITVNGTGYYVNTRTKGTEFPGPDPWYSLMASINGVIQELRNQATGTDLVGMFAFDEEIKGLRPLSKDLDILLQLTNPNNRGTRDLENPDNDHVRLGKSFIDQEWFPVSLPFTDLSLALTTAINEFSANCPAGGRRILILATDGLANVHSGGSGDDYEDFLKARQELIQSVDIMPKIKATAMQVAVLHFGDSDMRNLSRTPPDPPPAWGGGYYFPGELAKSAQHYYWGPGGGTRAEADSGFVFDDGTILSPFDWNTDEENAWYDMLQDNAANSFYGANGMLFDLARTGVYCPLKSALPAGCATGDPWCSSHYVKDHDGLWRIKDTSRVVVNDRLAVQMYGGNLLQQASGCLKLLMRNLPIELVRIPARIVNRTG